MSHTSSRARDYTARTPELEAEEIDLRAVVRALLRYRWMIVLLLVLCTLAGIAGSLLSTTYRSQGLFLTPGLGLPEYKQYENAFRNERRLERYLQSMVEDEATAELLRRSLRHPNDWAAAVRPVFTITGKDAKDFDIRSEDPGAIVGLQLTLETPRKTDEKPIMALAEYLRSTVIELDIRSSALGRCVEYNTREEELARDQLRADFRLEQQHARIGTLRELIERIPGAKQIDNRQVVSLENGGERFLSPVAQLVAAEIEVSEMDLARKVRERDRIAAGLYRDYYCQARNLVDTDPRRRTFFEQLAKLRATVLEGADAQLPAVRQVASDLSIQQAEWAGKYLDLTRFVVSPAGAEQRIRKPGLSLGALLGAALGLLFGAILAVAAAWWHDNRDEVLAPEDETPG